jgi:integrase
MRGKPVTIQEVTAPRLRQRGYKFVVVFRQGGKRSYKYCRAKGEAETEAQRLRISVDNSGREAAGAFEAFDKIDLVRWRKELAEYGATLGDAVTHYLAFLKERSQQTRKTVRELFNAVLDAKERERRSERYQDDLRVRLARFSTDHGERVLGEINKDLLDRWLHGLGLSAVSTGNFRRVLGVAFSHAVAHGWLSENPVARAMKPKVIQGEIGILTPEQLQKLLEKAHEDILPALAIGAFAGLRRAEIERMEWKDVDLVEGFVQVRASNAKSARRRLVRVRPALAAWLQPYAGRVGRIWPEGERGRLLFDEAKEKAGFTTKHPWPSNALRHSFATYVLASTSDAATLSLEMGHTDQRLIFAHYRELVKPKAAAAWWAVLPTAPGNVVQLPRVKAA